MINKYSAEVTVYMAIVILSLMSSSILAQHVYNIKDFGAIGDGKTLNTDAIQAAVDHCSQSGGGQVVIPNGCFLTGTIDLKNDVELYLSHTAVLKGSPDLKDYALRPGSGQKSSGDLIYAYQQKNISISGKGTIDGNGEHPDFHSEDKYNGLKNRPHTIHFVESSDIKLKEFTLRNGATWNFKIEKCQKVTVDDITVISMVIANNDGLDLVDCHDVRVANSYFDNGDDAICLKSDSDFGVKRITITNCIIRSESNAIKFGTAGDGGFEDITISNCVLHDTRLSGIALEMVDGGTLNRVTINNIVMHRVNGAIFFKLGKRRGDTPGIFKNVFISNVIADEIGYWKPDMSASYYKDAKDQRIGTSIVGQPGYMMENIVLDNIYLQFAGGGTAQDAQNKMADRPDMYPEYTNFGITPAYGINCQYVKDIQFRNIKIDYIEEDVRPAMHLNEVQNILINSVKAKASDKANAVIRLSNAQNIYITGCNPSSVIPFLSIEDNVKDIALYGNDFSKLKKIYIKTPKVSEAEIRIK